MIFCPLLSIGFLSSNSCLIYPLRYSYTHSKPLNPLHYYTYFLLRRLFVFFLVNSITCLNLLSILGWEGIQCNSWFLSSEFWGKFSVFNLELCLEYKFVRLTWKYKFPIWIWSCFCSGEGFYGWRIFDFGDTQWRACLVHKH